MRYLLAVIIALLGLSSCSTYQATKPGDWGGGKPSHEEVLECQYNGSNEMIWYPGIGKPGNQPYAPNTWSCEG